MREFGMEVEVVNKISENPDDNSLLFRFNLYNDK